VIILSTFFGLGLGTVIGWFITFDLLKNLRLKTEYKQIQSKIFMFTFIVGRARLICACFFDRHS
jgi:hypothetical protein